MAFRTPFADWDGLAGLEILLHFEQHSIPSVSQTGLLVALVSEADCLPSLAGFQSYFHSILEALASRPDSLSVPDPPSLALHSDADSVGTHFQLTLSETWKDLEDPSFPVLTQPLLFATSSLSLPVPENRLLFAVLKQK